jgi:WD40 repeat protein
MRGTLKSGLTAFLIVLLGGTVGTSQTASRVDLYGDPLPAGAVARMGSVRFRHYGLNVVFTADSRSLVTGTGRSLHFWEPRNGTLIREIPVSSYGRVLVSTDGKYLAVPSDQGVRLFDPATGNLLRTIGVVHEVLAFSADSHLLATAGRTDEVSLWDPATGQLIRELRIPPNSNGGQREVPIAGQFTPDQMTFVAIGQNGTSIRRWNLQTGELLADSGTPLPRFKTIQISPDARTITVVPNQTGELLIVDAVTGQERFRVNDVATGRRERQFAFTRDGQTLIVPTTNAARGDTLLAFYDAQTGEVRRHIRIPVIVQDVTLSLDDKFLLTRRHAAHHVWDLETGRHIAGCEGHDGEIWSMAFTPDGRRLLTGSTDGTLRSWEAATGKAGGLLIRHSAGVHSMAISPDGMQVLSGGGDDLLLHEIGTGRELRRLSPSFGRVHEVGMSPDGRTAVFSASQTSGWKTLIWDFTNGGEPRVFSATLLGRASDARWCTSGSPVTIQDPATGQFYRSLPIPNEIENVGTVSADMRTFVTISSGPEPNGYRRWRPCTLHVWELASGKELYSVAIRARGDTPTTFQIVISPDGRTIAATRGDCLQVWDLASGQELLYKNDFSSPPFKLAFSPDNHRVATGHVDGSILVWDLSPQISQRPGPPKPNARLIDGWWQDLADDARRAHPAIWGMIAAPDETLDLLDRHLVVAAGAASRAAVVSDEDRAPCEPLEFSPPVPAPEQLRQLRAIQILERIGTIKAVDLLTRLSQGPEPAWVTRDAQAALKRLANQPH